MERTFPSVARWVKGHGWIEIGDDGISRSFIRALDEGGLVWEGEARYQSVDDALRALDNGLAQWLREPFDK